MANALQANGANPGKQTKAAPIYTGRFFSGINTNRSPLRDATTRYNERFIGPAGDTLIDGSNLEVTNKLTLGRRPGNPIYDTKNEWQNILSFDDFRISKALPDVFGFVDEQIDLMISEGSAASGYGYEPGEAALFAITGPGSPIPFQTQVGDLNSGPAIWRSSSTGAGQSYGTQVGNEWYFGNGVDNKKWLQSLFVRNASNDAQTLPINTYPFMSTYYIDPNNNIQQIIGAIVQTSDQRSVLSLSDIVILTVQITDNSITLTTNAPPFNPSGNPPIPIGTQYMIWSNDNGPTGQFGIDNATAWVGALAFLQGMTITTTTVWTAGGGGWQIKAVIDANNLILTTVTANTYPNFATLQIENGGVNTVNNTLLFGGTPTWSTQGPAANNNFGAGITFDGQAIWANRGQTVENWGIGAPTISLATPGLITTFGAQAGNWEAGTYYSPASITTDSSGNLWMITKPGTNPAVPIPGADAVTPAKKFDIYTVEYLGSGNVTFGIENPGTSLATNDTFQVSRLRFPFNAANLNTPPLTLSTSQASELVFTITTAITSGAPGSGAPKFFTANCPALAAVVGTQPKVGDAGYLWTLTQGGGHAPSVYPVSPASAEAQWTFIQTAASLNYKPNWHYYEDDFVSVNGDYKMLYKGVQPFIHSLPPQTNQGIIHYTGGTWTLPTDPVTSYNIANANTGPGNPTFDQAGDLWPYVGYKDTVTPPPVNSPDSVALFFMNISGQVQPTGPTTGTHHTYLTDDDDSPGNLLFYYVGGNAYLNISGTDPGATTPPLDSGNNINNRYGLATVCNIYVPFGGSPITFNLDHNAAAFYGFIGASIAGTHNVNLTNGIAGGMIAYGSQSITGSNAQVPVSNSDHLISDPGVVNFGSPGCYILEIDSVPVHQSDAYMIMTTGGTFVSAPVNTCFFLSVGQDLSWPTISWNGFTTSPATTTATTPSAYNVAPFVNEISWANPTSELSNIYWWMDIGPTSNYSNPAAGTYMTASGVGVIYNNSLFYPYTAGISGATVPNSNFASTTTTGVVVLDSGGTLQWMYINQSSASSVSAAGTITALGPQGFIYSIALVNTLDNTVSNLGPSNEINGQGIEIIGGRIFFTPGAGLNTAVIDPQADYVAIFRTAANGSIELLVPSNGNTIYTVPLVQYLNYGYLDNTQDADLDILIQGATQQENTPPLPGAVNLTYYLNRIWYSIGNTVWYTTGPLDPSGNGINGAAPGNNQVMISRVTRLVPSAVGMLVFTLSDVYVIPINNGVIGTASIYVPGMGLSSYNALDVNGALIGLFTTDHQFVQFNPSVGVDVVGNPIANILRLDYIDEPGMAWNPADAYVAWYVNGEDMGWFLADGRFGWYRLITTPAPEKGEAWSPFATVNPVTTYGYASQGCGAIKAVEVAPGDHRLLTGPALLGGTDGFGSILYRDLDASTDGGVGMANGGYLVNGSTYSAYGVFGSYVCAHPGQIAMINFITTDQVNVGSPLILGVIFDEALPYYEGSFDIIKNWVTDPPNLPESSSILGQRFYMSEAGDGDTAAMCRHMQILIQWPAEAALNELQSFTIFGSFGQEA